ncbi:MAG: hypothetical protein GY833_15805, partial [Aestuariibacter sp.]|nr:hypothetical protein [Aestuariibacter sp.]
MNDDAYGKLPFEEAIEFFRKKLNISTRHWNDIWKEAHNKAFMIAGAQKADLLMDFRTAVEKAVTDGATLYQFQKDFDAIVKNHGWDYHGSRNWRSRIIYETNVRQAYNAGRERQMADP